MCTSHLGVLYQVGLPNLFEKDTIIVVGLYSTVYSTARASQLKYLLAPEPFTGQDRG